MGKRVKLVKKGKKSTNSVRSRKKTIERDSKRCFEKSDWFTLVILVTIIFIPMFNLMLYGTFASDDVVDWPKYYTNGNSTSFEEYASKNTTKTGSFSYAFPPLNFCVPPDSPFFPNDCFDLDYGDLPFTFPVNFGNNLTVDVNVLAGRYIMLAYNDTEEFHYNYEYSFNKKTIHQVFFTTPIIIPFLLGGYQVNQTDLWSNMDIIMYLRDSDGGIAKGWRLTNESSVDPSDYERVTVDTGHGTFEADVYDVDISFPAKSTGIIPLPHVKPIDTNRILPFALPSFEMLGIPIDFEELLSITGLDELMFVNDQLYGWYQWDTVADRLGVAINIRDGVPINTTSIIPTEYLPFSCPNFQNTSTFSFLDISMFAGKILSFQETVLSITVLDGLLLGLAIGFVIFVNVFKFPGRKEYEDLREAYEIKYLKKIH